MQSFEGSSALRHLVQTGHRHTLTHPIGRPIALGSLHRRNAAAVTSRRSHRSALRLRRLSLSLSQHTHTHTHSPAATPPPPTSFSDSTCADPPPHGGAAIPRCSRNSEIKPKNSPAKRRGRAPPNKRRQSFASGEGAPADVTPIRGGSAHGSACTRRDLSRAGRDIFATTPRRVPVSAPSSLSLPRSCHILVMHTPFS